MGKIALLFAGQGAQYPGMGKAFYDTMPETKAAMDQLEVLRPGTLEQCFFGSKEILSETINTQPCMFAVDYGIAKAVQQKLQEHGHEISALAGFSLGEIPAIAFSGMIELDHAFALVCYRADVMQHAAEQVAGGMMAVLKLSAAQIEALAAPYHDVYAVNYNSPEQTAVAGNREQLQAFAEDVKKAGGRAVPLAVNGAFHSPYMQSAADALLEYVEQLTISQMDYPVYANRTGKIYTVQEAKKLIALQVNHPVQWVQTITAMIADGVDCFVEVGPGKTLSGLVKKIASEVQAYKIETPADLTLLCDEIGRQEANVKK